MSFRPAKREESSFPLAGMYGEQEDFSLALEMTYQELGRLN